MKQQIVSEDFMAWMQEHLGVPEEAVATLGQRDDWTTVIVMYAIVESLLTRLLVTKLDNPEVEKVVTALALGGSRSGKIAWCKAYNLLTPEQITFIDILGKARNGATHHIHNFGFTFQAWISELKKKEAGSFNNLAQAILSELSGIEIEELREDLEKEPRAVMTTAFWFILANARTTIEALQSQSTPKE
jgi:hypothetical protein